jgi:hypothetical protein
MGKTQYKPLAERHGMERHGMCESAFKVSLDQLLIEAV